MVMLKTSRPQRLETAAGVALAFGDGALLSYCKLGLICSRRCPGDVIIKTYDFARLARAAGLVIVSGFHSPIEKDCLPMLLHKSDPVIIVPGHRLSISRLSTGWQSAIERGRLLILSPFSDKQKRVTSALAVERNRFVAAIANEILIAYAAPDSRS